MASPPRRFRPQQHTALLWAFLLISLAACDDAGSRREALEERMQEANALAAVLAGQSEPPDSGEVRIRLAFGAAADLDLYVTGPGHETVYFANTPARSGGELDSDLRCPAPAPRIETVLFRPAEPGVYRVGVDFPERCDNESEPVSFVVFLETADKRQEKRGAIAPGRFLPIVMASELAP